MKQVFSGAAAILLLFITCKKYDDGPALSFRSKMNRIIGYKKITSYTIDGSDSLASVDSLFSGCSGQYYYFIEPKSSSIGDTGSIAVSCPIRTDAASGQWLLENPKNEKLFLRISYPILPTGGTPSFPFNTSWTITRLKEKELWLKTEENGKMFELKFESVPKP